MGSLNTQARCHEAVDGVRLCLADAGQDETVVFLAGWPQSIHAWRKVMPRLAERYHVVAIDPPGLGCSAPLPAPPDTQAVAACLARLLDELGHERFVLVGHDIGAWIGTALAATLPDRVRGLVAIDAAVPGLAPDAAYAFTPDRVSKVWHFFFNALADLPEALIEGRERLYLDWLFRSRSVVGDAIGPADLDQYVRCYARPGAMRAGFDHHRAIFRSIEQDRAWAQAARVPMPVLAIGGAAWLGGAMRASFEPVAERLTSTVIEGCGHFVPEESPEQLSRLLLGFLIEVGRSVGA